MTQVEWHERLAAVVATEVRRYRKQRGMSAQDLSDRCAELGMSIKRSVLANLESGRRTTVTLPELLILARALGAPPLLLAFPVAREEFIEVLPGRTVGTWQAAQWFTGEGPLPTQDAETGGWGVTSQGFDEWQSGAEPLDRMRGQDDLFKQLVTARGHAEAARKAAGTAATDAEQDAHLKTAEAEDRNAALIEREIRLNRQAMRTVGLVPPELNSTYRYLDDTTGEEGKPAHGQ